MKVSLNEHGVTVINLEEGTSSGGEHVDTPLCLDEERELTWMRDTKIMLLLQMELMACRDDSDWLIRCSHCAVNNFPKECCPSMPLPIHPDYHFKM